jgi:polysaccharide export outer membrane protein
MFKRSLKSAAFGIMVAGLMPMGGCSTPSSYLSGVTPDGGQLRAPTRDDISTSGLDQEYSIGALDMLEVRVIGFPEFDAEAQVDYSGRIQLPLVGEVVAAGMTPAELSGKLNESYDRTFLKRPQVSVSVKEIKSRFVSIEGEVKRPGLFPMPGNLTLSRTLSLAEGPSEFAKLSRVAVFRTVDGKQMAAIFDLQDIRLGKYDDPKIYPNDIVVVGSSSVRRAFRDIIQTAPFIGAFAILSQ